MLRRSGGAFWALNARVGPFAVVGARLRAMLIMAGDLLSYMGVTRDRNPSPELQAS